MVDGRGVRVLDLLTGKPLAEFAAPDIACEPSARGAGAQTVAFSPDGRRLATGHRDGSVTIWAVPAPPAADAADVWATLGHESPTIGRAAVNRVARDPAALKDLLARFRPPAEAPDPKLAALIADLDSDSFTTRESATRKLRELGGMAGPALRRALAGTPWPRPGGGWKRLWRPSRPRSSACRWRATPCAVSGPSRHWTRPSNGSTGSTAGVGGTRVGPAAGG